MNISKEQFDEAYNKYGPSKFLKFVYTHYNVKLKAKPTPIGTLLGVIGWFIGTIGLIVFDQLGNHDMAMNFLWAYIPFAAFVIALPAHILNNLRIKRISKKLGISISQYNNLVNMYYGNGTS